MQQKIQTLLTLTIQNKHSHISKTFLKLVQAQWIHA